MMEKDRLGAFIDAVLAIIMTILVLELPRQVTEYVYVDGVLKSGNAHPCYFVVVVDATGQTCQSIDIYAE